MKAAIIAEISAYAAAFNQRIGQFITNALHHNNRSAGPDLFNITDEDLLDACREYFNTFKDRM